MSEKYLASVGKHMGSARKLTNSWRSFLLGVLKGLSPVNKVALRSFRETLYGKDAARVFNKLQNSLHISSCLHLPSIEIFRNDTAINCFLICSEGMGCLLILSHHIREENLTETYPIQFDNEEEPKKLVSDFASLSGFGSLSDMLGV